ncbi:MAG: hypothetical protein JXC32_07330, partial [Anaerolineae bacterium]|nr:hypothetical protein [Anaerolineae bacterium]
RLSSSMGASVLYRGERQSVHCEPVAPILDCLLAKAIAVGFRRDVKLGPAGRAASRATPGPKG